MIKIKLPPKDHLVPFEGLAEKLANGDAAEQLNWFIELRDAVNEGLLAIRYPSGRLVMPGTIAASHGIQSPHLLVGDIAEWLAKQGFVVDYVPIILPKKTALQQEKEEVKKIAAHIWGLNKDETQTNICNSNQLKSYANKYRGKNTLRNWIKEVDPRSKETRRGRPSKNKRQS